MNFYSKIFFPQNQLDAIKIPITSHVNNNTKIINDKNSKEYYLVDFSEVQDQKEANSLGKEFYIAKWRTNLPIGHNILNLEIYTLNTQNNFSKSS